ncbi:hypothetical protein PG993_002054 [Apiospora rasikravindrae]|uniref:DNA replication regulator Sld3 C-terminal domain-containing protein n=1 Tax=Apiospora rasikravindrae TaxID=990691 RepID=A0ABR1UDQ7_9PEZI
MSARKRKHDDVHAMEELLRPSIVVRPHPQKLSVKPRSLQPLMLLPREHLSLASLDLASPQGDFGYARFFESTIKILDLEGRLGARPVVLIARLEGDKSVYALERQDNGLYSLCKLGSWVNLEQLSGYATVTNTKMVKQRPQIPSQDLDSEPLVTPQLHKETKKRRLAIEAIQSMVKKPQRSASVAEASNAPSPMDPATNCQTASHTTLPAPETQAAAQLVLPSNPELPIEQNTADDIFNNIRNQYIETLYHSMGSLAYFAKGPLSRARAAFHLDCDSNLDMNDLIDFLKSLVLSTQQIDTKYKSSVPDIIALAKTGLADSGDEQTAKAKKRKSKKMKLGKNVLYPDEDEHVRKWWSLRKPQRREDEDSTKSESEETRLQILYLRTRETQLQIILILEILALESSRSGDNGTSSQFPTLPGDESTLDSSKQTPAKKRNKHNFPVLLVVQADRLSIWQSTTMDGVELPGDSHAADSDGARQSQGSSSDPLRDFCIDIIVPFYSARLPQQCDEVNRKLGGPVMPSPPKPRSRKTEPTAKPKSKPGSLAKRPTTSKSTHSLERVLSKETERNRRSMSRGPGGMIALMRSASTPTYPVLKREASESTTLSNVPRPDSKDSSHAKGKSSAVEQTPNKRAPTEDKAKKEAQMKAELQEAISSLRKPNREVAVGKALEEAEERRATTTLAQLRKSRKPTQYTRFQDVVQATPVGHRFRDALGRAPQGKSTSNRTLADSVEKMHISPSASLISSSAPRKRDRDTAFSANESPALPRATKPSAEDTVATPARPSTLKYDAFRLSAPDEGVVLASSPVLSRRSQYLEVPGSHLKPRDSGVMLPSSPGGINLAETPVKRPRLGRMVSIENFVTVTPAKKRTVDYVDITPVKVDKNNQDEGTKTSVYEQLGWDDYDDLF